jgi:hypothetical protein
MIEFAFDAIGHPTLSKTEMRGAQHKPSPPLLIKNLLHAAFPSTVARDWDAEDSQKEEIRIIQPKELIAHKRRLWQHPNAWGRDFQQSFPHSTLHFVPYGTLLLVKINP